ncbi:MAG: hypothetical protein AAGF12_16800 [Myxococcota bacterium]
MKGTQRVVLYGAIACGAAALGAGGTYVILTTDLVERFEASLPIAEALLETEGPIWPPQPEGPAEESPDPAPSDAEDAAANPVARLPELPPDSPGFRVRSGELHDLVFLEHIIGEAEPDQALPLIVVLHGRGDAARVVGAPFVDLTHPVRVIVPQAPDPLGRGYQWLPVRVGQGLVDRLSSTLFLAASRLAEFIRAIALDRPTLGRPIVTGFSQGGLLTLTLALHHDDIVGHAFPIAAWLPPPLEPSYRRWDLRYPAIRSMHGTADAIIPLPDTREMFGRLEERGFDVSLVEFEGVAHHTNDAMNELFHAWLDAAVCGVVEDLLCAFRAAQESRSLQGKPTATNGVALELWRRLDAGIDAGLGVDAAQEPDAGMLDGGVTPMDASRIHQVMDAASDASEGGLRGLEENLLELLFPDGSTIDPALVDPAVFRAPGIARAPEQQDPGDAGAPDGSDAAASDGEVRDGSSSDGPLSNPGPDQATAEESP